MQDQPLIEPPPPQAAARNWRQLGLSAKLLLLTLAVIMLAEILIFVPSVANFRDSWLRDRLRFAEIAALAAEAAPEGRVPEALRQELLMSAQVKAVALKRKDMRMPLLLEDMPPDIAETFDLRTDGPIKRIGDALTTLLRTLPRAIRVIGTPGIGAGEFVEIVMLEAPLKAAMVSFGLRILGLSIFISVLAAAMVYLALNGLLVRPIERMVANMMRFSANPEDASRIIQPSARTDEIGTAEHQLAAMQRELAQVLHQKTRLAALGLAVSKINHDLRNMLANAQLISDRFQDSSDPTVKRFAPKLIGSLDRAIRLCTDTLRFGRAEEEPPKRSRFLLQPMVEEAGEGLGLPVDKRIGFVIDVAEDLIVDADPNQLFRVLTNLLRNALQVIDAAAPRERIALPDPAGQDLIFASSAGIKVTARRLDRHVRIDVSDSGPGIPEQARQHLFEAFQGSVRKGGTGLGLAICAEIMRAHGGAIELAQSGPDGTTFRLTFPDAAG
jgi:signal transduction histidine kinase